MWFERFVICCTSLSRDFIPSSWDYFSPTMWDWLFLIGSFGLFFTLFLLFCRFLPVVAIAEVKTVMPQAHGHEPEHHGPVEPGEETEESAGEEEIEPTAVPAGAVTG
jgi:molybdopterin-containing oxidoreductase family membrane subunit